MTITTETIHIARSGAPRGALRAAITRHRNTPADAIERGNERAMATAVATYRANALAMARSEYARATRGGFNRRAWATYVRTVDAIRSAYDTIDHDGLGHPYNATTI